MAVTAARVANGRLLDGCGHGVPPPLGRAPSSTRSARPTRGIRSDLAYYAGCDEHILALYAVGGAGYVSTVANVVPDHLRAVLDAFDAGDTARAAGLQQRATALIEAVMANGLPGTVTAKALLTTLGLPAGPVRPQAGGPRHGRSLHEALTAG
ncbi:4-hydroxy-tetrahydrodipicolinate synthase [Streptomyces hirsutus]